VLLTADRSVLMMVDLQERLIPVIADGDQVVARAGRLACAATLMSVPVVATEQYPKGLGHTVAELSATPGQVLTKTVFSAVAAPGFDTLLPAGREEIVMVGAEAHVCVLQTAIELRERGLRAVLVADAVGSRSAADRDVALERALGYGIEVVTSEMVLFEWARDSSHPRFREIQRLLR
jgi:nicotinamidase-related amidase